MIDGTWPHGQIPFQFSLHTLSENRTLVHHENLSEDVECRRRFLLRFRGIWAERNLRVVVKLKRTNRANLDASSPLLSNAKHRRETNSGGETYVEGLFNRAHSRQGQRGF